jgi:hypothetical protein
MYTSDGCAVVVGAPIETWLPFVIEAADQHLCADAEGLLSEALSEALGSVWMLAGQRGTATMELAHFEQGAWLRTYVTDEVERGAAEAGLPLSRMRSWASFEDAERNPIGDRIDLSGPPTT